VVALAPHHGFSTDFTGNGATRGTTQTGLRRSSLDLALNVCSECLTSVRRPHIVEMAWRYGVLGRT
jgi:hypothetical protein